METLSSSIKHNLSFFSVEEEKTRSFETNLTLPDSNSLLGRKEIDNNGVITEKFYQRIAGWPCKRRHHGTPFFADEKNIYREETSESRFQCIVALISGGISRLINENRNRRPFIILANYQLQAAQTATRYSLPSAGGNTRRFSSPNPSSFSFSRLVPPALDFSLPFAPSNLISFFFSNLPPSSFIYIF